MEKPTYELILFHGRHDPNQDMDDWGFDMDPPIRGVVGFSCTYLSTFRLHFVDDASFEDAKRRTGWSVWDVRCLEMSFHEDMVMTTDALGVKSYFGDWHIQQPRVAGEGDDS